MKDVLCPGLINGFRSGSGPFNWVRNGMALQSHKSVRAEICREDGCRGGIREIHGCSPEKSLVLLSWSLRVVKLVDFLPPAAQD